MSACKAAALLCIYADGVASVAAPGAARGQGFILGLRIGL